MFCVDFIHVNYSAVKKGTELEQITWLLSASEETDHLPPYLKIIYQIHVSFTQQVTKPNEQMTYQ